MKHRKPREILPPLKEWGRNFRVALVYPNAYRIGMANLGIHMLYSRINGLDGFLADRFFMESHGHKPPLSIERFMPLREYDCVAFSLHFEPDYPAVIKTLELASIKSRTNDRTDADPFIIAGGPSISANPEPLADFLDCVFIGEFEEGGDELLECLRNLTCMGTPGDSAFAELARLPHVYVPSLVQFQFDGRKIASFTSHRDHILPIQAARPFLAGIEPPSTAIYTDDAEFSDMRLVEFTRGCRGSCRFCLSGNTTGPFRVFDPDLLVKSSTQLAQRRKIGVVGELFAGHPGLLDVIKRIIESGGRPSFSSIRLEFLSDDILKLIVDSGIKSLTLAPETGSEKLACAINKPLSIEKLLTVSEKAAAAGIENLRLYLMAGIPGEDESDIELMLDMAHKVHKAFIFNGSRTRLGHLTLSVNPFIPKPWTPFQWAGMANPEYISAVFNLLKSRLKGISNLELRTASPDESMWEAVLSRADRRSGMLIETASKIGWRPALKNQINDSFPAVDYALVRREESEIFPWEVVFHGSRRELLWREFKRALDNL